MKRQLIHVKLSDDKQFYFGDLFGYTRHFRPVPEKLTAEIDMYKAQAEVVAPEDVLGKDEKREVGEWAPLRDDLYICIEFGGNPDLDYETLFETVRRLHTRGTDTLTTLAIGSGESMRICNLYPVVPDETGGSLEVFPEESRPEYKFEISLCIPTYNRRDILLKCLMTLAEDYRRLISDYPGLKDKVEVIVIDDGSTDGTRQALENLGSDTGYCFRFSLMSNRGPAAARNAALSMSCGRVVIFIDDDKIVENNFLRRQYEFHQERRGVFDAAVGFVDWPKYLKKNFLMEHIVSEHGLQQFAYAIIHRYDANDLPFSFFVTANLSVKRELLLTYGRFNEKLFRDAMWEDSELGWRLKGFGMKLHYLPDAVVYHDHFMDFRDFARRQFKVGNYVARLSDYSFMARQRGDEQLKNFNDVVSVFFDNLDFETLLSIAGFVSEKEAFLLEIFGRTKLHIFYHNMLLVAYLLGLESGKKPHSAKKAALDSVLVKMIELFCDENYVQMTQLFYDTGQGFSEELSIKKRANIEALTSQTFSIEFDVSDIGGFKALRWDPIHAGGCKVRIEEISFVDSSGGEIRIDPMLIEHNGRSVGGGWVEFLTPDPIFLFRGFSGKGRKIVFRGEWEKLDNREMVLRLNQIISEAGAADIKRIAREDSPAVGDTSPCGARWFSRLFRSV